MINKKTAHLKLTVSFLAAVLLFVCSAGFMYSASAQTTWDTVSSGTSNVLRGVVFANSTFVAVGANGTIRTSPNGTTWTARTSGTTVQLWDIVYGNAVFVAIGENQTILTSSDGITWTSRHTPATGIFYNIAFCNGTFAVTGSLSTNGTGLTYTSPDGITWTQQTAPGNAMWGMSSANNLFFAWQRYTYISSTDTARFFSSSNASTWTSLGKNAVYKVEGVAYGNSTYVTVGDSGTIYTSPNGTTWTRQASGTVNTLWGIIYANSTFFAVGNNNTILLSTDGISWNNVLPADTSSRSLSALAYGAGVYVAVGTAGEILVSNTTGFQAPVLTSPATGTVVSSLATTTLSWTPVSGALTYNVQGSTSSSFTSLSIEDSTLTVTSKGIIYLPANTYYWRVRAKNTSTVSGWSGIRYFSVIASAPGIPAIIAPASGSTDQATTLQLSWSAAANATSYHIQIATSSAFTTLYKDTTGNPATQLTVTGLSSNSTYYWRVSGINVVGQGSWSVIANFTTVGSEVPGIPTLISPASGTLNVPQMTSLVWSSVAAATSYHVQVAATSAFTSTIADSICSITTKTLYLPAINTKYFWRVYAINSFGQGNWSAISNFTTVSGLPAVTLVSPAKGALIGKDTVRLIWNKGTSGTTQYAVQLAVDSAMTIFIINNVTYTDTALTVRALTSGITYWWRVRAYNSIGWGAYSSTNSFKNGSTGTRNTSGSDKNVLSIAIIANSIHYTLPSANMVSVQIFDLRGRLAATPVSMFAQAGTHDAALPASLPSGRYLLQFKAGANTIARPVVIIK